jgi:hypothetical protein
VSQEQANLWVIRGMIGNFPEDNQRAIRELYNEIKTIIVKHGDNAKMAIALIGAELAAGE